MPRHSRNEVKAGALMVVAFVLLCAGIFIVADFGALLRPKKTYHFTFDMVEGLKASDDVMYAGIKCGRVTGIEFREYPECDNNVGVTRTRVLVTVEADATVPIRSKDKPKVTRGLTGNVFMDIIPYRGESENDRLGNLVVQTTPDNALVGYHYPSFGEVSDKAQHVLGKMGDVLDSANDVVRKVRVEFGKVAQVMDNITVASVHIKDVAAELRGLEEKRGPVGDILDNTRQATADVREVTAHKQKVIDAIGDVRETVDRVHQAVTRMGVIIAKADRVMDNITVASVHVKEVARELRGLEEQKGPVGDILENTRQATHDARAIVKDAKDIVAVNRPGIDGTIEEMRQTAARLNLAMEDIRRNPWKLLSRNIEADAYTQNIYDASMSFAEGARALSMASATLENLLARKDADPALVRQAADNVNKLVSQMATLEKLLYEAMKKRP